MNNRKNIILSLGLRVLTLFSKSLLLFYVFIKLPTESIGEFGLLASSVIIGTSILGLDYYTFNTREILKEKNISINLISEQFIIHLFTYILILPFSYLIFYYKILDIWLIWYFYILLILEHINTEVFRILINLQKPIQANISQFLRGGLWILALITGEFIFDQKINLGNIFLYWVFGSAGAFIFGSIFILEYKTDKYIINFKRIISGLKIAGIFFIGTILLRLNEFIDRFLIKSYLGLSDVGIYTFYSQITSVIQTLVSTGIILILYPKIINHYQKGENEYYQKYMKKLNNSILISGATLSIIIIILSYIYFSRLDNRDYIQNFETLIFLVMANYIILIATVPNYSLYVRRLDKKIVFGTTFSLISNVTINYFLIPIYGILGASIASFISAVIMFCYYKYQISLIREKNIY